MNVPGLVDDWVNQSLQRLAANGFVIQEGVPLGGVALRAVARRSRFELSKFGYCETFFTFLDVPGLSFEGMRRYSAVAFDLALRLRVCGLPCGLFEAVMCFAVAITDGLDVASADRVRNETPPKHWSSMEIPVIYDARQRRLVYFERTPMWGAAYYRGFRNQINQFLAGAS